MEAGEQERWRVLCEQATREEDPKRLIELVQEINTLLADGDDKKKLHTDGVAHNKSA